MLAFFYGIIYCLFFNTNLSSVSSVITEPSLPLAKFYNNVKY